MKKDNLESLTSEPEDGPMPSKSGFLPWFCLLIIVMIALNFARLAITWRTFGGDGYEQIGFPFPAFERGGLSYSETLHWHWLLANATIAIAVASVVAYCLRDGLNAALRKFRHWGHHVD